MHSSFETSILKDHLEKLYAFCIIAKMGSLSQACRQLESSQAALSHSLKTLETALKVELFHRTPRGVTLTEPGKVLYEFAKKILLEMDTVEEKLKNPDQTFSGKLHLGTETALSAHFWPPILSALEKTYPEMNLNLACGKKEDLIQSLLSRELHAIVTVEPNPQKGLKVIPLYETDFKLFASPSRVKGAMSIESLGTPRILADSVSHLEYFNPAMKLLATFGIQRQESFVLNHLQTVIQMTLQGLGFGFLPEDSVRSFVKSKQLVEVKIAGVPQTLGKMKICLTVQEDSAEDKLVQALTEVLIQESQTKHEHVRLVK